MQQATAKRLDARARVHPHGFVDEPIAPASSFAIEKPQLIIGIPTPAANPSAHIEGPPRDAIAVGQMRIIDVTQLFNRG